MSKRSASPTQTKPAARDPSPWTFLTNHAHVLLCIASNPEVRMRDAAERVGITERAVQRIVMELEEAGYVSRVRIGRRNRYAVNGALPLRHPIERHRCIAALIDMIVGSADVEDDDAGGRGAPRAVR
jgi:Mn-dependent DtxR family transcriptional regulator